MTGVKYVVRIPSLPGVDCLHAAKTSAEHEAANARRQGHEATVEEVLVAIRPQAAAWAA